MSALEARKGERQEAFQVEQERRGEPLAACIGNALDNYFHQLGGEEPADLFRMVMGEVERPLFETVMRRAGGNQTRAAAMLGINRGTLRKKLRQYGLE